MTFSDPFRKLRCPFCNKEFLLSEYLVVSRVTPGKMLHQPSKEPLQRVLSRVWSKPLAGYKQEFASRQCPQCGNLLPPNTEQVDENITIAVIGDTFSGKSHYIAAAIDQLKRIQLPERYFHVIAASQDIEERYRRDYYNTLFELHRPIPRTKQATNAVNEPLIYQITLGETERRPSQRINLFIYDASGEDLALQIPLMRFKPHILNARAIIFLADPWAMPDFVDRLAHNKRPDPVEKTGRMSSEVISWVVETFKSISNELAQEAEFPLPLAIALSKADLIPYLLTLGTDYAFLADPAYLRIPNPRDTEIIDQWTRKLLSQVKEDSLLGVAKGFRTAKFFAISATGSAADQQTYSNGIRPHRCLDPLFWVLRELDIID